jgi:hypothetical protein
MEQSDHGQAEDALPEPGTDGTGGENRQLSRSGNWAAVACAAGFHGCRGVALVVIWALAHFW